MCEIFPTFKMILLGDGGVGKTQFFEKFSIKKDNPFNSLTYSTEFLLFDSNYGKIGINLWDTKGQEKLRGLRDAYYINSNCAIIMVTKLTQSPLKIFI